MSVPRGKDARGSDREGGPLPATEHSVGPVPDAVWAATAPVEQDLLGNRLAAADEAEALCAPLRPPEPHLTVATIGVRPDHQGRGIAKALIRPATILDR